MAKRFMRWLVPISIVTLLLVITPAYATTVTTSQFTVTWVSSDPEAITSLSWVGSSLTNSFGLGACNNGDVEYWGNSWAPPDPQVGGKVLVGSGSTGSNIVSPDLHVTISSITTSCTPQSASIPISTVYKFYDASSSLNKFKVTRTFTFGSPFVTPAGEFRPYIPRLFPAGAFSEVRYPNTANTIVAQSVFNCPFGGPPQGSAVCQTGIGLPSWNGNFFVVLNPSSSMGIVVTNISTQWTGGSLTAQLWIDFNGGSFTDSSSVILLEPTGGFTGTVTEEQTFCFFGPANPWSPPAVSSSGPFSLPNGC